MYATTVLGLALAVAAPAPKEAPKKDPPPIVGEWECVGLIGGGRGLGPGEKMPEWIIEFTADGKYRSRWDSKAKPEGTYSANTGKDPAEVDLSGGGVGGKAQPAIYKIEKDLLTLCYTEGGGPRPTAFDSPRGTRILITTFKRVEKKKKE